MKLHYAPIPFKKWFSLWLILLTAFSLTACNNDSKDKKPTKPAGEQSADTQEDGADGESTDSAVSSVDKEIANLPATEITIPTRDGLGLYGKLYDPTQALDTGDDSATDTSQTTDEEAPPKKYPLVILLHSLNGTQKDWENMPAKLVKQGYAVFAIDLRGHGKSTRFSNGEFANWRNFEPSDWQKLPVDLEDILTFFGKSEEYIQVDSQRVAFIGASVGANTALIAASKLNKQVQAIVLISPNLNFKGLSTVLPSVSYTHSTFITMSQQDPLSYSDADSLYKLAQGPKAIRLYRNLGHGMDMLRHEPKLKDEILTWLNKQLPGGPKVYPAPPSASTDSPE